MHRVIHIINRTGVRDKNIKDSTFFDE